MSEPRSGGTGRRRPTIAASLTRALGAALVVLPAWGCQDFTGSLTPVPPGPRAPVDVAGAVILIDKDPTIETRDANHVLRANERGVPRDYRLAMTKALELAGFKVVGDAREPHDLVARLALAVSEEGDRVRQVYRCGLAGADGSPVAQIDWAWPKGKYVGEFEVYDFATHNLATEISTSRTVNDWLRRERRRPARPSGDPPKAEPDANTD